jgi:hypothetical protein
MIIAIRKEGMRASLSPALRRLKLIILLRRRIEKLGKLILKQGEGINPRVRG